MRWIEVHGIGYVAVPIVGGIENERDKVRISKFMRGDCNIRQYYEPLVDRRRSLSNVGESNQQATNDVELGNECFDFATTNVRQRIVEPRRSVRRRSRMNLEAGFVSSTQT